MRKNQMIPDLIRGLRGSPGLISRFIKSGQILMLMAGLAAFSYGAFELGLDLWFSLKGVKTEGVVVGQEVTDELRGYFPGRTGGSTLSDHESEDIPVYRPTIRYRWPADTGEVYLHHSTISFEGEEMARYGIGNEICIRVLPNSPANARLPGGFTHYLWATLAFVGGLMAIVLVSALFYLHEGLLGSDSSKGISLFRSVRFRPVGCLLKLALVLSLAIAFAQFHQRMVPWLGGNEVLAIVTGEIRLLPPLLAAKGAPSPGQHLNDAESAIVRIPGLGTAFADEALERALSIADDAEARRYLAAMADPASRFQVQSPRILAYAAERGKTDFVKMILAAGVHPDTAIMAGFEPIRQAARRNHVAVIEVLLAAGAKSDYPGEPLIVTALDGGGQEAVALLLARTKPDLTWCDPENGYTLVDRAVINGMAETADLLRSRGVSATLPGH